MAIYFGADHRGFELKEALREYVRNLGYEAVDLGATAKDPEDDYPDFAAAVGRAVSKESGARGVLVCGSGAGMDITANKFKGVRASLGFSPDHVFDARHDDDLNVLVLAANFVSEEAAKGMLKVFLQTPFDSAPRRVRRLQKITAIEEGRQ